METTPSESPSISIVQMDILPGCPDLNAEKIIREIDRARDRGDNLIVFPEMAIPGYLIGDEWDNEAFIRDCEDYNREIAEATYGTIAAVWGSVKAEWSKKNEDGRVRKYNAGFVAQGGEFVSNGVFEGWTPKTLLPNYREFDDKRYFYSALQLAQEMNLPLKEVLQPFEIMVGNTRKKIGVSLCEDIWSDDYADDPISVLIKNGSEILANLSCSPWTWRKNAKRHQVVRDRVGYSGITFIYANNVGSQDNGKNIFNFDGSSTVYENGKPVVQLPAYEETTFTYQEGNASKTYINGFETTEMQDAKELHAALINGICKFFASKGFKKAVIGLSGGIDSAVSATLLVEALGAENVYAVNMPSKYNSDTTKDAARELAENLGIYYSIVPIQESVDHTTEQIDGLEFEKLNEIGQKKSIKLSGLDKENIQARDRGGRILPSIASAEEAVFVNNGNKTEIALGYATLYGDINGSVSIIGDIYKQEVFQLARYINSKDVAMQRSYGKPVIPKIIIDIPPSAELSDDQNIDEGKGDPINYEYHDRLIRAFVEFRKDPEEILEAYANSNIDELLNIPKGTVAKYYPNAKSFIADLEHKWKGYKNSVFKRIQAPPIITVSRRAFGFDLRESQSGAYFTRRFKALKAQLLNS